MGPLIVWVLLIHKDAINSPKSNRWVRRDADSETRSCSTKRIDPRTPRKIPGELHHADQSLIVRPSAGALQQTSTQVMHQKSLTHFQQLPAGRLCTSLCRIDQLSQAVATRVDFLRGLFCSPMQKREGGRGTGLQQCDIMSCHLLCRHPSRVRGGRCWTATFRSF